MPADPAAEDAARPARRRRTAGIAARAGLLYLFAVWAVVKFFAPGWEADGAGIALAKPVAFGLAAGLVVIVLVARRFGPLSASGRAAWGPGFVAAACGLAVPSFCVTTVGSPRDSAPPAPEFIRASVRDGGQLRLRVHGLTAAHAASRKNAAELVISTEIVNEADAGAAACLRVRARLLDADGVTLWERFDEVDPEDLDAVHRAVLRALAEGMGQTSEGAGIIAALPGGRAAEAT